MFYATPSHKRGILMNCVCGMSQVAKSTRFCPVSGGRPFCQLLSNENDKFAQFRKRVRCEQPCCHFHLAEKWHNGRHPEMAQNGWTLLNSYSPKAILRIQCLDEWRRIEHMTVKKMWGLTSPLKDNRCGSWRLHKY